MPDPLFDREDIGAALNNLKAKLFSSEFKGTPLAKIVEKEEPIVNKYINAMVSNSMTSILSGFSLSSEEDDKTMVRVAEEIRLVAVKSFLITRELYRDQFNIYLEECSHKTTENPPLLPPPIPPPTDTIE